MPYFTHDQIEHYYEETGSGFPLVFLHGLGASHLQVQALLGGMEGIRLIMPDFRSHGRTEYGGDAAAYQIAVLADDIMGLTDHLGLERVAVGGISLGAAVALNLSLRFPERVQTLILVRPAWLNDPFPINLDLLVRMGKWIEERGVTGTRDRLLADPSFQAIRERYHGAADGLMRQLRRPRIDTTHEMLIRLPASVPFLEWQELRNFKKNVLVLTNFRDPLHPHAYGERLAEAMPAARLEVVAPRYRDYERHRQDIRRAISYFIKTL